MFVRVGVLSQQVHCLGIGRTESTSASGLEGIVRLDKALDSALWQDHLRGILATKSPTMKFDLLEWVGLP